MPEYRTLPDARPVTPAAEYVRIARLVRRDGSLTRAIAILETATRMTTIDGTAYLELGRAYAQLDRLDRALEMFDEAVRLDPDLADAHWERGLLLERRGQVDDALAAWERSGLATDPYRHSLYLALALKSPRATNESLLEVHREWARHHAGAATAD